MRPWQITYTAQSSAASKSTIEHFWDTWCLCHFNYILRRCNKVNTLLNVKISSYMVNNFRKEATSSRYMDDTIFIASIWWYLIFFLNPIWNFDREISRVLSNVRDVQEYTWHTIPGEYLYAERRHWHSACRHWYQGSCWEREPMQISKSKESDTLLLAVGSHQQNVEAVHSAVKKRTKGLSLCFFLCACVRGCTCILSFPVYLCVCACVYLSVSVSTEWTKEQNKPEVAWQHKTLPNVNFEDAGTAGGGERRKKETEMESREGKKGCCDCNALLVNLGRAYVRNIYYIKQETLCLYLFVYVLYCVCRCMSDWHCTI